MSIRFDAVTPDGERLHFEDFIYSGEVVHDNAGTYYVVGPDLGDELPRLMPMDQDHYMAYWRTCNPHAAALL